MREIVMVLCYLVLSASLVLSAAIIARTPLNITVIQNYSRDGLLHLTDDWHCMEDYRNCNGIAEQNGLTMPVCRIEGGCNELANSSKR